MSIAHSFFQLGNVLVLPAWVVLLFFPGNTHLGKVVQLTALVLAMAYVYLISNGFSNFDPTSFGSLHGLRGLFASDAALAAGWLHYLCFDLLVGHHIVMHGREKGISRWKYTLPLPFTFFSAHLAG